MLFVQAALNGDSMRVTQVSILVVSHSYWSHSYGSWLRFAFYRFEGARPMELQMGSFHLKRAMDHYLRNITSSGNREALFAIVHDASKPATTVSDWTPKGICRR